MKILFVVESAVPYGANKCLIEIIDRLLEDEHSVQVVGSDLGALADWLKQRSVKYSAVGHKLSIYPQANSITDWLLLIPKLLRALWLNSRALFRIVRICRDYEPDIIHTNIGPCTVGYFASRLLRVNHVWHVREYQDEDFGMSFFPSLSAFRQYLSKTEEVVCITQSIAWHFDVAEHCRVINDGVAKSQDFYFRKDKERYFLFAGRLEPAKGVEDVISSFLRFCESDTSDFKLLIAGDGHPEYVSALKSRLESSEQNHRIEFLGFRNDILSLMRSAKALIVASRCEGFGLITPEAMFNGAIVIGRNTGGTSEILRDENGTDYGFLFNDNDQLVDCMHDVVALKDSRYEVLALKAQKRAVSKYSLERNYRDIREVYENLIDSRKAN